MSYKNQMKKRKKISRKFAKKIEKTKKLPRAQIKNARKQKPF